MEAMILLAALYVLPIIIAISRKHRNVASLAIVCLLLGWTIIGWVACLAWAFTDQAHRA